MISRFWRVLKAKLAKDQGTNAPGIRDEEDCARLIYSRSHYNTKGAKPQAFLPNPSDNETSVFIASRYSQLSELDDLAHQLASNRQGSFHGKAMFKAEAIRIVRQQVSNTNLTLVLDERDHRNHANIVGWPEDKSVKKLLAQGLASHSQFKVSS